MLQLGFDGGILGFSVDFGQHHGGKPVTVHVVALIDLAEHAVGFDGVDKELDAAFNLFRVRAFIGQVAIGHEGHQHIGCHRDRPFIDGIGLVAAPRAIRQLLGGEIFQGAIDDHLGARINLHRVVIGRGWGDGSVLGRGRKLKAYQHRPRCESHSGTRQSHEARTPHCVAEED